VKTANRLNRRAGRQVIIGFCSSALTVFAAPVYAGGGGAGPGPNLPNPNAPVPLRKVIEEQLTPINIIDKMDGALRDGGGGNTDQIMNPDDPAYKLMVRPMFDKLINQITKIFGGTPSAPSTASKR